MRAAWKHPGEAITIRAVHEDHIAVGVVEQREVENEVQHVVVHAGRFRQQRGQIDPPRAARCLANELRPGVRRLTSDAPPVLRILAGGCHAFDSTGEPMRTRPGRPQARLARVLASRA